MLVTTQRRLAQADGTVVVDRQPQDLALRRCALVICDMWDRHWCNEATRRVAALAPRLNALAAHLRAAGCLIVHAPSETMDYYARHPARLNAWRLCAVQPTAEPSTGDRVEVDGAIDVAVPAAVEPPLPIDDGDGGCPCRPPCREYGAWTCQHAAIAIAAQDVLVDDAGVFAIYDRLGIDTVLIAGVHTNFCVLGRPFGIRAGVRNGYRVLLVSDLTDSMYNPVRRPYVCHDCGTALVVEHIERYCCATIGSDQILGPPAFRFS